MENEFFLPFLSLIYFFSFSISIFFFYFIQRQFQIIGYYRLKRSGKCSPISHCRAIVFYTWSATIVGVLACVLREIFKVNICSGNTCRTSCLAIISYVIYEQTVYVLKNATIMSGVCRVQSIIIVFLVLIFIIMNEKFHNFFFFFKFLF